MIIFAPNIEEEMNWTDIKDIGITTLDVVLEGVYPPLKQK